MTVKVISRKSKSGDGKVLLFIRVGHQGNEYFKSTGVKTLPDNFNADAQNFKYFTGPGSHDKNLTIKTEFERIETSLSGLDKSTAISPEMIRAVLSGKKIDRGNSFYQIAADYNESVHLSPATASRYRYYNAGVIKPLLHRESVSRVNTAMLREIEQAGRDHGYAPNTVNALMRWVKAVVNYAINKRSIGIDYPFGIRKNEYKIPVYKNPTRFHLTESEVKEFERLYFNAEDPGTRNTARWFMLQVYSGQRHSDLKIFNKNMIRGDKLVLKDVKEKNDHYVPMNPKLQRVIDSLEAPVLSTQKMNYRLNALGAAMGLPFTLTSHVGRHTYAIHSLEHGFPLEIVSKMLGHSDIKTTMIYAKFTSTAVKNSADKVYTNEYYL